MRAVKVRFIVLATACLIGSCLMGIGSGRLSILLASMCISLGSTIWATVAKVRHIMGRTVASRHHIVAAE